MNENPNWKFETYVRGSIIGLMVGIVAAYLYTRAVEENNGQGISIGAGDMVKVSLTILGLVRQITELGSGSPNNNKKSSSS